MPDIFDYLKEHEEELYERPPEKVWHKIEQKLARNRRSKRRNIPFLQPWAVALILLILILAAVVVWHYSKK